MILILLFRILRFLCTLSAIFHSSSVLLPFILHSAFVYPAYYSHIFTINSTLILHHFDGQPMDNRWTIDGQSTKAHRTLSEGRVEDETIGELFRQATQESKELTVSKRCFFEQL